MKTRNFEVFPSQFDTSLSQRRWTSCLTKNDTPTKSGAHALLMDTDKTSCGEPTALFSAAADWLEAFCLVMDNGRQNFAMNPVIVLAQLAARPLASKHQGQTMCTNVPWCNRNDIAMYESYRHILCHKFEAAEREHKIVFAEVLRFVHRHALWTNPTRQLQDSVGHFEDCFFLLHTSSLPPHCGSHVKTAFQKSCRLTKTWPLTACTSPPKIFSGNPRKRKSRGTKKRGRLAKSSCPWPSDKEKEKPEKSLSPDLAIDLSPLLSDLAIPKKGPDQKWGIQKSRTSTSAPKASRGTLSRNRTCLLVQREGPNTRWENTRIPRDKRKMNETTKEKGRDLFHKSDKGWPSTFLRDGLARNLPEIPQMQRVASRSVYFFAAEGRWHKIRRYLATNNATSICRT